MINHYVMFKMKSDKKSETDAFIEKLKKLKDDVPAIADVTVIKTAFYEPKSYDLLYIAKFKTRDDLNAYMVHPKHVPVMKYVEEVCADVAVVDYID